MIAEGTDASKVTDEQIAAVAADAEIFLKAHKISRKEVATALGYSPGVVSEFLAGTYLGNRPQVAIDLEGWLVEEEQRRSRPATTQFVWTSVAITIKSTASYCLDRKTIGLVYGPDTSGIGKTTALRAIHQELGPRKSTMITIDDVDCSPTGVIRKICAGLRIGNDKGRANNRNLFQRLVEELKGRSHILLIDQIHNLRGAAGDKPFYILTDLYDATGAAQLWCGTADLVNYLERQRKHRADESLAQIRRRIFPQVDLMDGLRAAGPGNRGEPLVTIDQVREMFVKNKLKITSAGARFLCDICNLSDGGSVGLCVRLVEYATMVCELRRLTMIDVPQLQEAMRRGLTSARADLLAAQMPKMEQTRIARSA